MEKLTSKDIDWNDGMDGAIVGTESNSVIEQFHTGPSKWFSLSVVYVVERKEQEDIEAFIADDIEVKLPNGAKHISCIVKEQEAEQQKPVEWLNGQECVWGIFDAIYIGMDSIGQSKAVIQYSKDGMLITDRVWIQDISKPESPEEKAAREREEKAKALYHVAFKSGPWDSVWKDAFYNLVDAGINPPE